MVTFRISARRGSPCRQAGFSLLELLLTLVVIGLIVSLAGLSVSSGRRSYEVDAALKNFADIAEYALDEAQLSGRDMGLVFERRNEGGATIFSFQWLQRDGLRWQPAPMDEDAYGRRDFPLNVDVALEVEQDQADVDVDGGENTDDEEVSPQVIFYASGETTPGIMTWVDDLTGDLLWELEWDLLGRMSLRKNGLVDEE
jgi:general secretion pathway protein H